MPPKDIVRDIRSRVQKQLLPALPKRWHHQFTFGIRAFGLKPFASANSNARKAVANPHTAGTKVDRLLANMRLAKHFGTVFDVLKLVRPSSFVNIDHSDFNGLMVLAGGVQTGKGRALPCMVETTYSDRLPSLPDAPPRKRKLRAARAKERQQVSLTTHTVRSLKRLRRRLGFWPKLVFDRGFCAKEIICLLAKNKAVFYVRMKADRLVGLAEEAGGQVPERTKAKSLNGRDNRVWLYGYRLRIVRSRRPQDGEPWYILTNDLGSTAKKVLRVYRHRFEIEETFKDMKHIFELRRTRLNKPGSLKVILWLVSLGIALLYAAAKDTIQPNRRGNQRKQRSWLRNAYEQLELAQTVLLWSG